LNVALILKYWNQDDVTGIALLHPSGPQYKELKAICNNAIGRYWLGSSHSLTKKEEMTR
jgi:hypothetical protein